MNDFAKSTLIILKRLRHLHHLFCNSPGDFRAPLHESKALSRTAGDLVQRMTLEEKASQLVNQGRAIPCLHVTAYDWWSEALHGVTTTGKQNFLSQLV